MTQIISNISSLDPLLVAQAGVGDRITNLVNGNLGSSALGVIKAIVILVLGLIVASIVKGLIKKLLNSTDIDNRIASAISGQRGGDAIPIEDWISSLFYWLVVLFAVVAFLNALQLDAVSAPLNTLLSQITGFIPKILGAAFLLGIAWVVATIVKTLVTTALGALNIEQRLGLDAGSSNDFSLTDTLGNALYWFIFLLFLPAVLNALQLNGTLEPIQEMLNEILAMLPNVLGAVIIGAVFWFIATIVRRIVANLLAATGVDNIGRKFGLGRGGSGQSLSSIIGTVVFVLILIPGIISALEQLQISAISEPATDMLNQVLDLMPKIFAAGVVLAFFYVAGQFVSDFVTNILTNFGFNNLLQWLGLSPSDADLPTPGEALTDDSIELGLGSEQPTMIQTGPVVAAKTPSELVGLLCLVGIMLIATLTAVDILGIPALQEVVSVILAIAAQVLIGVIVFAIGLYLANLAHNLILASGATQAGLLAQSARIAILVLVGAMALNRIGIAPNIVNLAFGLILGGIAVAIALAFGLGGREVAKEELRSWVNSFKGK
ncbi:mechanosensitive ion channel [Waterburya agarophytonicola K14]|uniref:Mechanosensitive ion channel n=1 Tax=Waterburya agarophytonicola KI4 TaxID=2874699 RepID=A0A964BT03_9CYAN|nr:mechanosensitive ion channel [Waterburya agarophytonicola]MCC0177305.1 mechanosensitive ion channel [Waterburya agarophytonicola KI4]